MMDEQDRIMLGKKRWIPWIIVLWSVCLFSWEAVAQGVLPFNQEVQGSLPLFGRSDTYFIDAQQGKFLEVILNLEERDFALSIGLIDITGNVIAVNGGVNFPSFAGVYLYVEIPRTARYQLVVQPQGLDRRVDYTLLVRQHDSMNEDTTIQVFDTVEGIIGPSGDFDAFDISLRAGNPVLFVLTTPNSILDSVIGILTPAGEVAAFNDDFFGTSSTLFFIPETTGVHRLIVQGSFADSVGPYQLHIKAPPLHDPPFTLTEQIDSPGDMFVYQIPLNTDEVYDFTVTGVDGLVPLVALSDRGQNIIASNEGSQESPIALIQGFTPVLDEPLYVFVMANRSDQTGAFGLDVTLREDEEDGIELQQLDIFAGVIGPVGDEDVYRFTADANEIYSLLVTPTAHFLDPALRVVDSSGNELFFNDDSADHERAFLSGVEFPATGEYFVHIFASPDQPIEQRLTGVYVIQIATGTTFDREPPRIFESGIQINPAAGGVQIVIPTSAIADDTFPLSATIALDKSGDQSLFTIEKNQPVSVEIDALPDDIFYLSISDSAWANNTAGPVTIPAPRLLADLEGHPTALAVDANNRLFLADSQTGQVVRYTIEGATDVIVSNLATQGGTLGPNGLAFDPQGVLHVSNASTNSVVKILPDGATETVVADLNFPRALTFDPEGNLYIAQVGFDSVLKITPDGTQIILTESIRNPSALAFSPEGVLYVSNNAQNESGIYRIEADGTTREFVEPFSNGLNGLAFDRDGFLYVTEEETGFLYRFSPEGERQVFTQGIGAIGDVEFGHGPYSKTLFASSGFVLNRPPTEPVRRYEQRLIGIPTGRTGIPVPDIVTEVRLWMMF